MTNKNDDLINNILNELDEKKNHIQDTNTKLGSQKKTYEPPKYENVVNDTPTEHFKPEQQQIPNDRNVGNRMAAPHQQGVKVNKAPNNNNVRQPIGNMKMRSAPDPEPPKNKKKKHKKKKHRLPGVLILTTFIFAVSICLSLVIIAYGKEMLGVGKSETTHLIIIPDGATTEDVAQILENDGIIDSPDFFTLFSKLSKADTKYIAGEHFIRPNMAYETIIKELTSVEYEKKQSVEVTFPEGITLYDAAALLEENGVCSIDDFLFNFNAGGLGFEFENKLAPASSLRFYRMEGFLFPDTYFFYEDMDPEQVCQKIYMNFDNKMTEERYRKMENLNLSLDQLITFASIVQKEAATTESMTLVASVFWNRLNHQDQFPLLQSDPTRLYSENVIKPHIDVYDQVIIDSYNTYVSPGLPPGPICNPGTEAIDAVLEAFESDYYYFIANVNTGQTYFSSTLEEHEAYQAMIQEQYEEESQEDE